MSQTTETAAQRVVGIRSWRDHTAEIFGPSVPRRYTTGLDEALEINNRVAWADCDALLNELDRVAELVDGIADRMEAFDLDKGLAGLPGAWCLVKGALRDLAKDARS